MRRTADAARLPRAPRNPVTQAHWRHTGSVVPDDEHEILARAQRGSVEAFALLVRRHQARVRGYLGGTIRGGDLVDDLAQEVFLAAFRDLASYNGRDPFGIWLLGIARHRALMHLRTEVRRRARETRSAQERLDERMGEWGLHAAEGDAADLAGRAGELEALRGCLEALPERSAAILRMHYLEERSAADIARALGKHDAAVRMMLMRVRQALRGCVRQRLAVSS